MAKKSKARSKKRGAKKGGILFSILGAIFLVISIFNLKYILSGDENIFLLNDIKQEIKRTQSKIFKIKTANQEKKEYVENLRNDPEIIEEEARRSLNLVKDNEILFILEEE